MFGKSFYLVQRHVPTLCVRAGKKLASLCDSIGSYEASLLALRIKYQNSVLTCFPVIFDKSNGWIVVNSGGNRRCYEDWHS